MYPRNAASPEPIAIGPVVQISDGAVQTAGVTVRVKPIGVAEADGAGTTAYSTDGVVIYTPTQAETNYTSFVLIAKKTGCIPASVTVVTSARSTSGEVQVGGYATGQVPLQPTVAGRTLDVSAGGEAGIDFANIGSPTTTVNLSGLTIKTATDVEADTQDIQARLPAALVGGRIAANAEVVGDKTGYKLASDGLALVTSWTVAITGNITGNLSGSVGSVTGAVGSVTGNVGGSVGSISGVTFPTHFNDLVIAANGHVTATVDEIANNTITAASIQGGAITSAKFAAGAIDANALATDAATEIATAVGQLQVLTRLDSMIESDGAGQFRFDTIALSMAPAGGGGGGTDWTSNERTAIRSIFGFDSSGVISLPSVGVLDAIKDKTDLITSGTIQTSLPVTASGQITGPLYIGDDYLQANGRAFSWTVALPTGMVVATATCKLGMDHAEGSASGASFVVTGSVIDAGSGNVELRFDVPKATTGTLLEGFYRWSVEIASAGGNEVTRVANKENRMVEWRSKQT